MWAQVRSAETRCWWGKTHAMLCRRRTRRIKPNDRAEKTTAASTLGFTHPAYVSEFVFVGCVLSVVSHPEGQSQRNVPEMGSPKN